MPESLQSRILLQLQTHQLLGGIYIEDLTDGVTISINADKSFPSASIIKTPIAVHILHLVESGQLDLTTTIDLDLSLSSFQQSMGSGIMKHLTSRLELNIHDLLYLSLAESDNLATNELLKLTTLDAINDTLRQLGLTHTRVTLPIENFKQLAAPSSNPTTAREMGALFKAMYHRRLPLSDILIDLLASQKYNNRIPFFLPEFDDDLLIPHKTGSVGGLIHDTGLVMRPEFSYTICILTHGDSTWLNASMAIAHISKLAYDWMTQKYSACNRRPFTGSRSGSVTL